MRLMVLFQLVSSRITQRINLDVEIKRLDEVYENNTHLLNIMGAETELIDVGFNFEASVAGLQQTEMIYEQFLSVSRMDIIDLSPALPFVEPMCPTEDRNIIRRILVMCVSEFIERTTGEFDYLEEYIENLLETELPRIQNEGRHGKSLTENLIKDIFLNVCPVVRKILSLVDLDYMSMVGWQSNYDLVVIEEYFTEDIINEH